MVRNEQTYYFDFEFGGIGNPVQDLATILIDNYSKKQELTQLYSDEVSFSPDFNLLNAHIVFRACDVLVRTSKRDLTETKRKQIQDDYLEILSDIIN